MMILHEDKPALKAAEPTLLAVLLALLLLFVIAAPRPVAAPAPAGSHAVSEMPRSRSCIFSIAITCRASS